MIRSGFLHQVIRSCPVAVTIQKRADNATAQHPRKRFLISFRLKGRDDFIAAREAANVQALFVGWPAPKASVVRRVGFLDAFFGRGHMFLDLFLAPLRLGVKRSRAKAQRAERYLSPPLRS